MSEKMRNLSVTVKEVGSPSERVLRFIGSDETVDRSGDVINVDGWVLDAYRANPVFMYGHDYGRPPVGKTIAVEADRRKRALVFDVKFPTIEELSSNPETPSEHALFADLVYNMYKTGMLNAVSVGFRGKKAKPRDDEESMKLPEWQRGMLFLEQELFELSAVPIPDNPNALVAVRGMKGFRPESEKILPALVEKTAPSEEVEMEKISEILSRLDAAETELKELRAGRVEKAGRKYSKETIDMLEEHASALEGLSKSCGERAKAFREYVESCKSSGTEAPAPNDGDAPKPDNPENEKGSGTEAPKPNDGPAPTPKPEKAAEIDVKKGIDEDVLELED